MFLINMIKYLNGLDYFIRKRNQDNQVNQD